MTSRFRRGNRFRLKTGLKDVKEEVTWDFLEVGNSERSVDAITAP